MSEREELILVTSFESLRPGDVVVTKDCELCGGTCRGMLLQELIDDETDEPCWEVVPWCVPGDTPVAVGADEIEQRVLYRVVIPPTSSSLDTTAKTPTKRPVVVGTGRRR